jgi:hypothetical protein
MHQHPWWRADVDSVQPRRIYASFSVLSAVTQAGGLTIEDLGHIFEWTGPAKIFRVRVLGDFHVRGRANLAELSRRLTSREEIEISE